MSLKFENPTEIYHKINHELSRLMISFDTETSDQTLNKAHDDACDKLLKLQNDLKTRLYELQKNAEWNTFTIAFYGETGAGKSTLIETLRILLNEPSKRQSRDEFQKVKLAYEQSVLLLPELESKLEVVNKDLEQLALQYQELEKKIHSERAELNDQFDNLQDINIKAEKKLAEDLYKNNQEISLLKDRIESLQVKIREKKANASFWTKIILVFKKLPEELALLNAIELLATAEVNALPIEQKLAMQRQVTTECNNHYESQKAEIERRIGVELKAAAREVRLVEQTKEMCFQQLTTALQKVEEKVNQLTLYADGEIIGDGRADFTRKTQCYEFNVDNQIFNLLDVPGIEGKEGLVLEEIETAVQTAHAVFYVTNKAAPPQTGDVERKGTLEKIKQHLGAQTEVWSIFNKRITNPKYGLNNGIILSEDELQSLAGMDAKMCQQLGSNYQGHLTLTALSAFVAATDCLAPNSQHEKRRKKFLEDFSEQQLLSQSGITAFIDMLKCQLLLESKSKINKSNFNKAKTSLDYSISKLDEVESLYEQLKSGIRSTSENARHQLDASHRILKSELRGKANSMISAEISKVRQSIYKDIEEDISNDSLKARIELNVQRFTKTLETKLPEVFDDIFDKFESSVEDIFVRFSELSQEYLLSASKLGKKNFDSKFNVKIEISNGINKAALLGALVAAVMVPFTAGASIWIAAASAFTAVLSFGKAVYSFFSSDFKMSEQKKIC